MEKAGAWVALVALRALEMVEYLAVTEVEAVGVEEEVTTQRLVQEGEVVVC